MVLMGALEAAGCGGTTEASRSLEPPRVAAVLAGVEQRNVTLGDPDAPHLMWIYSDPDSLRYGRFAQDVLPQLIDRHVRPGRLRIKLAPAEPEVSVVSPSDVRSAAEDMLAASLQDRMWTFTLLYEAVGVGTYDVGLGRRVAQAVPGLDVAKFDADARGPRVRAAVRKYERRFASRRGELPQLRLDPAGDGTDDVEVIELPRVDPGRVLARIERRFGW